MKLRYYLRGLGIGILVTAIVMSVAAAGKAETLSDEEIRERAIALGMTDNMVLSEFRNEDEVQPADSSDGAPESGADAGQEALPSSEPDAGLPSSESDAGLSSSGQESTEPTSLPTVTPATVATSSPTTTPSPATTPSPTAAPSPSPSASATPSPTAQPSTAGMGLPAEDVSEITIAINSGDGSYTVCLRLEQAGLISSASEYDVYLNQNGYDRKLRVGNHVIPSGADQKTIAEILTGN